MAPDAEPQWLVYMLRCADGSLYTGVTTDLCRRLHEHNCSRHGARYTRARRPVQVVHLEPAANRSAACRREYQLKRMTRAAKEKLLQRHDEPFSSLDEKATL
ncbi:MAG: GIY-YIG nuclease family protein [Desulfopila sp.]